MPAGLKIQLVPLHAAHHVMGIGPTLKTQLHLRQAFPVICQRGGQGCAILSYNNAYTNQEQLYYSSFIYCLKENTEIV